MGENLLHLCFHNNTKVHMDLVKKLLSFFPNMINDFIVGDEHYGKIDSTRKIFKNRSYFLCYFSVKKRRNSTSYGNNKRRSIYV